jgi:hypothetical protein
MKSLKLIAAVITLIVALVSTALAEEPDQGWFHKTVANGVTHYVAGYASKDQCGADCVLVVINHEPKTLGWWTRREEYGMVHISGPWDRRIQCLDGRQAGETCSLFDLREGS